MGTEAGAESSHSARLSAYRVVFLLGMALYAVAFLGGAGYALRTKGCLPEVNAQHLTQADELLGRGDVVRAAREYRMAARIDPTDEGSARRATELQTSLGEKSAQIDDFIRQRDLQPNNPATHRNLAQVLYNNKRYEEAVASFESAIRLQPGDARAYAGIGSVRLDQDRLHEAAQAFEQARARAPRTASIQNSLGIVAALSGRKMEAVAHFEEAVHLQPGKYENNLQRARAELAASREKVP